jgi:hypothetical protein
LEETGNVKVTRLLALWDKLLTILEEILLDLIIHLTLRAALHLICFHLLNIGDKKE